MNSHIVDIDASRGEDHMKCPYCDSENRDNATCCEKCEMPLNLIREETARHQKPMKIHEPLLLSDDELLFHEGCPHCGAPYSNCVPLVKSELSGSGGYSLFSGCCGTVLLGPLGLLCGLRRQSFSTSNQTWWACRRCGKEFLERDVAVDVADSCVWKAVGVTLVVSLISSALSTLFGPNEWIRDITLLAIVGIWFTLPEVIAQATGYPFKQLLEGEERKSFYKKCIFFGIIAFCFGLKIGDVIAEFLIALLLE